LWGVENYMAYLNDFYTLLCLVLFSPPCWLVFTEDIVDICAFARVVIGFGSINIAEIYK